MLTFRSNFMPPIESARPREPSRSNASMMSRARGCLFTFHRAASSDVWAGLPNRDFYLDIAFLDRLLTYLKRKGWAIVTLDEALRRAARNQPGDRYVNFSIDDCYRDTFETVVPLFRHHDVPVTLFVTTGIPDRSLCFWYTGLEDALLTRDTVKLSDRTMAVGSPGAKRAAFRKIARAWDGPQTSARYAEFCQLNDFDPAAVFDRHGISWEMLADLRGDDHVEIGAHTATHARISALDSSAALTEIAGSGTRLRERLGIPARHFAFPYGRRADCGPRDLDLVQRAGFASASLTRKGVVRHGQSPFGLPRNTLNGSQTSMASVAVHLSGLSGLAARLLRRD